MEKIYNLFFKDKKTTVEIAEIINVSHQYVSKVIKTKYKDEYLIEKERRKEINKTFEMMDKDGSVHKMYFNEEKTVSEIAVILRKDHSYITRVLQTYPEYLIEKERRKTLNREKQNSLNDDECHYKYRDRPLMPQETLSTISFIKMNRQSYILEEIKCLRYRVKQ
jgi:predicted transcriptional regulator